MIKKKKNVSTDSVLLSTLYHRQNQMLKASESVISPNARISKCAITQINNWIDKWTIRRGVN